MSRATFLLLNFRKNPLNAFPEVGVVDGLVAVLLAVAGVVGVEVGRGDGSVGLARFVMFQ